MFSGPSGRHNRRYVDTSLCIPHVIIDTRSRTRGIVIARYATDREVLGRGLLYCSSEYGDTRGRRYFSTFVACAGRAVDTLAVEKSYSRGAWVELNTRIAATLTPHRDVYMLFVSRRRRYVRTAVGCLRFSCIAG